MRHLLLLFLLITLLTSIDGGNIRKLRNALNAASDHELELLEMTMDVDMNGDMDMDMDMDMDADLDQELDAEDPPQDISNANNQGGAAPMPNVPQSTPNPGIIESIKQKGSSLWKKGKGLFGKGEKKKEDKNNGGTGAPGKKEGDKQGLIKKWKLKLKKGGANTKAKFCRKFQKRPAHCPPCPDRPRKSKKLDSNTPITSAPAQMTPSTPMFLESEMEMEMEMSQDMDWSGFPNLLTKFCGPPTCDCPKPKPKKDGFFKKLKLKLKKKNKPTQSNTLPGPTPVNNGQAPSTPA